MNEELLDYRLRGDPADAEAFRKLTMDFKDRLESSSMAAANGLERVFYQDISKAYDDTSSRAAKFSTPAAPGGLTRNKDLPSATRP